MGFGGWRPPLTAGGATLHGTWAPPSPLGAPDRRDLAPGSGGATAQALRMVFGAAAWWRWVAWVGWLISLVCLVAESSHDHLETVGIAKTWGQPHLKTVGL